MTHRYRLHVTLTVNNFDALEQFESEANMIMKDYSGEITHAYETERLSGGTGTEIHIVEFETEAHFNDYREDPRLNDLTKLRHCAITKTDIQVITQVKHY